MYHFLHYNCTAVLLSAFIFNCSDTHIGYPVVQYNNVLMRKIA